jgi:hypothetical protein
MQANFSEPIVNVIILQQDRLNFGDAPEKDFLNKDVCVTGVLVLRNDTPTLIVHNKGQLKMKDAAATETTR